MIQKINLNSIIQIKNKTLKNKKNDEKTWDNDLTENKSLEITESKKKQSKKKARTISTEQFLRPFVGGFNGTSGGLTGLVRGFLISFNDFKQLTIIYLNLLPLTSFYY